MRRIYEKYFILLGGYSRDDIYEKMRNRQDINICRALIEWINDGSHSISDDLYIINDEITADRYLHVFKEIFYAMGHSAHYNMMMGIDEFEEETE